MDVTQIIGIILLLWAIYETIRKLSSIFIDVSNIPTIIGQRKSLGEKIEEFNARVRTESAPIRKTVWTLFIFCILIILEMFGGFAVIGVDINKIPGNEIFNSICYGSCFLGFFGFVLISIMRADDAEEIIR